VRSRLRVLLPLGIASALSLLGDSMLYTALPSHTAAAGITVGTVGVILSVNRLVRIFINSPVGSAYDRFGRRRPFVVAMILAVFSTFCYAVVEGFWSLLASRIVWGIAWAFILVGGYSMVLDITTKADRGRTSGVYQAALRMGGLVGMLCGGFLTDTVGYRPGLLICTASTGLGSLVALAFLPETTGWLGEATSSEDSSAISPCQPKHKGIGWQRLDRRLLVAGYVSFAASFAGRGVLRSTLGLLLKQRFGMSVQMGPFLLGIASLTGLLLAGNSLLLAASSPLAGSLSDRIGDRWLVILLGLLINAGGFLILAEGQGGGAILLGILITALGSGMVIAALMAAVGDLAPSGRGGLVMGGFATANDLGGTAGPLVGYALGIGWGLEWAYLLCVLIFLSAGGIAWPVRATKKR
jgi:MFS family permease